MSNYRQQAWFIRRAKLAVALAIIKSKPAGKSGRQHAEDLASKIKQQEEDWKEKAEGLKAEVLGLRQDLLLAKLLLKRRNDAAASQGNDVVNLLSQEFPTAQLSENDSGCGTSSNTQTLFQTPDLVDIVFSSSVSPSSSRPTQFVFQRDLQGHALSKHMQFLQNLSALRGAGKNTVTDGGDAVVQDSALHMIEYVVEAYRDAEGQIGGVSQPNLILQASSLAAQALETGGSQCKPPAKCVEKVEELLKGLLELLVNNSQLNKTAVQASLTECLISLGSSGILRSVLIRLLLSSITQLAEHLWASCQGLHDGQQQKVVWVRYENSFYLFWILEQLIQAGQGRAGTEHQHIHTQLMRHVLPLSDEFPLFALYMWRIGGLLMPVSSSGT